MPKKLDITNHVYGRLTVIACASTKKHNSYYWNCRCKCGVLCTIQLSALRSGATTSCGCYKTELTTKRYTTHGKSVTNSKLYSTWKSIK